jgi:tRNA/tmRNA/rRNA uracil-C5-methylase (TrmA/RlmC/RlmD family)
VSTAGRSLPVAAGKSAFAAGFQAIRCSRDAIFANDGEGPLELAPDRFSQSNRPGNAAMLAHVASLLAGESIGEAIELYAGSGNFTRILARFANTVHAFEADPSASAAAARTMPKNVAVASEDAARALEHFEKADLLFVDPPRAGLDTPVLELAGRLAPRLLIYVSCDPATFARDLGRFGQHRLQLDQVRLFDLYPQTAHAEVIGRLRRIAS